MSRFDWIAVSIVALAACRDPGGPGGAFRAEADTTLAHFTPPGARSGPSTYSALKTSGVASATRELESDGSWDDLTGVLLTRCTIGWGDARRDERSFSCTRQQHNEIWSVTAAPISSAPLRVRLEFKVLPD